MNHIYTYGGSEFITRVFNAIAAMFNGHEITSAMTIMATVGLISMMLSSATKKAKLSPQWFLIIAITYIGIIKPKTTVYIDDKINEENSAVVDNVPVGIVYPASMISQLSDWLVRQYETVFSLPNGIKYRGSGMLFAQTLIEESSRAKVSDPRTAENLSEFWRTCVFYDLALELYSWNDIVKSGDLKKFFSENTSKTRRFTYRESSGDRDLLNCREGFSGKIKEDLGVEIENIKKLKAFLYGSESSDNDAIERYASAMKIGYQYLANISITASDAITQSVLANSLKNGIRSFSSRVGATAAIQDYAIAKSEAERKASFGAVSQISRKMLPILQHTITALIYSLFPLVVIICVFPGATATVFKKYIQVLAWVNLWPILFAVLNHAVTFYSQKAALASTKISGESLNMLSNVGLANIFNEYSMNAGMVALSVPVISWMVISGSGYMFSNFTERVLGAYEGPATRSAAEASSGNISMGQLSYQSHSAFQNNTAPSVSTGHGKFTGSDGIHQTTTESGNYLKTVQSSSSADINFNKLATTSSREALSNAESIQNSTYADRNESIQNMNAEKNAFLESLQDGSVQTDGSTLRESKLASISNDNVKKWAESFADQNNWSREKAWALTLGVQGKAGWNTGAIGKLLGAKLGLETSASVSRTGVSRDTEMAQKLHQAMNSESFSKASRADASAVLNSAVANNKGISEQSLKDLSSSISRSEQASYKHSIAKNNVKSAQEQFEQSKSFGSAIQIKGSAAFHNWLSDEQGFSTDDIRALEANAQNHLPARQELLSHANEYVKDQMESLHKTNDYKSDSLNQIPLEIKNTNTEKRFAGHSRRVEDKFNNRETKWDKNQYESTKNNISRKNESLKNNYNHPNNLEDKLTLEGFNIDRKKFNQKRDDVINKVKESSE